MIPAAATFWKKFEIKWETACVHCSRPLLEGAGAFGTKIGEKKWVFLCPDCHEKEVAGKVADEVEVPEDLADLLAGSSGEKAKVEEEKTEAPPQATELPYLERIKYSAPWRFKKGVYNG